MLSLTVTGAECIELSHNNSASMYYQFLKRLAEEEIILEPKFGSIRC